VKKFDEAYFAALMAKEKAESEAQVVATVNGKPVTRGELSLAFNAVANKENWKFPVNATVTLDPYLKAMVAKAVEFFTGSKAKFVAKSGSTTSGMTLYHVTAAGYYAATGA
jgi:hypothetical protein